MGNSSVSVALVGFSERERKVLLGLLRLSDQRQPRYFSATAQSGTLADIFLVDTDDPEAMAEMLRLDPDARGNIVYCGNGRTDRQAPRIPRPIKWDLVLPTLDDASAGVASAAATPPSSLLVVSSAQPVQIFLKHKFQPLGCIVDFAGDVASALERAQRSAYAMIFLDHSAETGDVYATCRKLKSLGMPTTPRVFLLATERMPYNKLRGAMSGCDGYLTKPIDERRLDVLLRRYFPWFPQIERVPESGAGAD